jgi:hypothetical protein
MKMKKLFVGLLIGLFANIAQADNLPLASRGHMGCSNTAALGMVGVGNGTGFCEEKMQEDFVMGWSGKPPASAIFSIPLGRARTCADNFAGSKAKAKTPSAGTAVFTIKKNGVPVATVTFTADDDGVWNTSGGATSFAVGDTVELYAPASQDMGLANVGFYFLCTR